MTDASPLRTFAVKGVSEVRVTLPVASICPYTLEPDHSTMTIRFAPRALSIELESLASYVDGYAGREITHEDLVWEVWRDVNRAIAPMDWLVVEDAFAFRGMTLLCRAGSEKR